MSPRLIVFLAFAACAHGQYFNLSVIHLNDFHARFDEQTKGDSPCKVGDECIGGFARVYTAVNDLISKRENPIFLNAGDNFQGTLYYNMFKWNITQEFMNMLPTTAYTLGNHEFDDGIDGVVPFIETMKSPLVCSNLDDSNTPEFHGKYNKSIVVEVAGKRIGIIGVIISSTDSIASTETMQFFDEVESVNAEAERLKAEENVFTIIVLSHAGYDIDQYIAAKAVPGISLIVGAHTHTLLYNGPAPDGSEVEGEYPTIVQREADNGDVLIVQAFCYTKYLGDITISYDDAGTPVHWEGLPLYLDENVPQDPAINELLQPYKDAVAVKGDQVIGYTETYLDFSNCYTLECNIGNFLADAMVASYIDKAEPGTWTYASIGILNAGGIRSSVPQGNISYGDMVTCQPFENTWDTGDLQGLFIKQFLEDAVYWSISLMQLSGIKVVYDLNLPQGARTVSIDVLCQQCLEPAWEPLDMDKMYKIVLPSFLAANNGADNYTIAANLQNREIGLVDIDLIEAYLAEYSPINPQVEGRITYINQMTPITKSMRYRRYI